MSATVIRTVGRGSCSWITRSATWIDVGSVKAECGVTSPSESAPATGISLNVEPGSYVSLAVRFRCASGLASAKRFASKVGAVAIA
jgi:hypothetical protein